MYLLSKTQCSCFAIKKVDISTTNRAYLGCSLDFHTVCVWRRDCSEGVSGLGRIFETSIEEKKAGEADWTRERQQEKFRNLPHVIAKEIKCIVVCRKKGLAWDR